ncbi:MAG: PQQ-binding-like beta-propeller repeat protein, partial [Sedimentisphaerales bacterium]|nr:PQQ-binding-like beta-propeller repeat protein [Sedimentisphaerales bacterium]
IRELDSHLRNEYFQRRNYSRSGSYLLLGGIIILLISTTKAIGYRKIFSAPQGVVNYQITTERNANLAFRSVIVMVAVLGAATLLTISSSQDLTFTADVEPEQVTNSWARFRGPGGLGISTYKNIPTQWNGITGENILWKTKIPLPGENSPIIWGNKIFLTGANEKKREVYCLDAESGKLLWQKAVPTLPQAASEPPDVMEDTGFAAPTAVTDGQRIYAIFANGDVICLNFTGKIIWAGNLGIPDSIYGYATSLVMYQNLLIIKYDQATDEDGLSKLLALEGSSGKTVWEVKRPVANSWSTPIIINADTPEKARLITCADPLVIAYAPDTGAEIWRVKCMYGDVAPSPVYANGLVYVIRPNEELIAIRTNGHNDVTDSHIAWRGEEGIPDIASPLTNGKIVLLLSGGLITCYDAENGTHLWEKELEMDFNASPSLVGNRIYLMNTKGIMLIIEAGREFREITKCPLGENVNACPAFADGRIYLRGKKHLFCISEK